MTTINQELYEALIAAGTPDDLAKRAAATVFDKDQIATKADLADLKAKLIKWMAAMLLLQAGLVAALVKLL